MRQTNLKAVPPRRPDRELLRQFGVMQNLTDEQLDLLASSLTLHYARKGALILQRGSTDPSTLFLVSGAVELEAGDGHVTTLVSGTPSAARPIAQLTPKQYDVKAKGPVEYLLVDYMLLQELQRGTDAPASTGLVLTSETLSDEDAEACLLGRIEEDLSHDRLLLPSLPEIAIRLGRALEGEASNAKRIALMLQNDPAITAKLIKAANSALFAEHDPVDRPSAAVSRLGIETTHKLVVGFALSELFRAHARPLQQRMQALCAESTRVAAISFVLARLSGRFSGEQAMVAGLIHNIGAIAIVSYAETYPELAENEALLDDTLQRLQGRVGGMILRDWNFPEDLVSVAEESGDWNRDGRLEPDYTDLVMVARLHSFIGTPMMERAPRLDEVACLDKLELGDLTPRMSLKILAKAEEQIEKVHSLIDR